MNRPEARIEMRLRNNRLWHAIHDHWESVSALCRDHPGLSPASVGLFLNLKSSPWRRDGGLRQQALKLSFAVGVSDEELYPRALYELEGPTEAVFEVASERLLPMSEMDALPFEGSADPVMDEALRNDLREGMADVLETISPRRRQALELVFGINGPPMSYRDAGKVMGVRGGRVSEIVSTAIRRLQHPTRAKILRKYTEGDHEDAG